MSKYFVGSKTECERLQSLDNKAAGLPIKGVHVGGGRHCDLDDGKMVGWTLREKDVKVHPVDAKIVAYPVADKVPDAITTAEKAEYTACVEEALPALDATWEKPLPFAEAKAEEELKDA